MPKFFSNKLDTRQTPWTLLGYMTTSGHTHETLIPILSDKNQIVKIYKHNLLTYKSDNNTLAIKPVVLFININKHNTVVV